MYEKIRKKMILSSPNVLCTWNFLYKGRWEKVESPSVLHTGYHIILLDISKNNVVSVTVVHKNPILIPNMAKKSIYLLTYILHFEGIWCITTIYVWPPMGVVMCLPNQIKTKTEMIFSDFWTFWWCPKTCFGSKSRNPITLE